MIIFHCICGLGFVAVIPMLIDHVRARRREGFDIDAMFEEVFDRPEDEVRAVILELLQKWEAKR